MGGDVVDEINVTVALFKKKKRKEKQPKAHCNLVIVLDFIVNG